MSCPSILEKNINRLNDLFVLLDLSPSEQKNIMEIAEKFPISIPAYYLSLINKEDKNDPIRKMAIPSEFEKISNVLISGGDSLVNSNTKIEYLLKLFTSIDNLDFIRFGTRIPVVMPQRISQDSQLLEILKNIQRKNKSI